MNFPLLQALTKKYNVPVPRYTSYPTVPFWKEGIDSDTWMEKLRLQIKDTATEGISLYIHLPFCETLCTYCGCNKKITMNHDVEVPYIKAVLKEWKMYLAAFPGKPLLKALHLGGGTPTFFSPSHLDYLLGSIMSTVDVAPDFEGSVEAHPNNTTEEHLRLLFAHGFTRLSLGVQDNDEKVQWAINRKQPWENVVSVAQKAREIGYTSINLDLIYGLPFQRPESIRQTINEVCSLMPDRIAYYSYAHIPWASKAQRLFSVNDLPDANAKMELYLLGREMFLQAGYADVGMDHFSKEGDALLEGMREGKLHRNFMGYTIQKTSVLIGLGVSSISDCGNALVQNEKKLADYYAALEQDRIPVSKGYFLAEEDQRFRAYILQITCNGSAKVYPPDWEMVLHYNHDKVRNLAEDGLITIEDFTVQVTDSGRNFLRNIASIFDMYLVTRELSDTPVFSKAV